MQKNELLGLVLNELYATENEGEAFLFADVLTDIGVSWKMGLPMADEDWLACCG